ncbi:hypothetical protein [Pedobacter psychroterrae]|uniref:DUF2892 family protein n=1 Tax=Pedobacter psychroterrae TaxID=2530453 RepID=A0A4R0NL93_9SPHI|nr:hypothetical protein [Pedobacter psychroterrae]TCD01531.1 hypothetical protein EZ437_12405 [Pedobacter psychroterrae]
MKTILIKNWNIMRLLRLGMGIFIITQGVLAKEWAFILMGSLLSLMATFNIGCCGTSGCSFPTPKHKDIGKDITYEEIK